jgi:hypothetical protein
VQAARGDGQHLGRRLVEPLGVLHDAQQRLLLGDVGQEAEHGEADEKRSGAAPALSPKAEPSASRWGPGS